MNRWRMVLQRLGKLLDLDWIGPFLLWPKFSWTSFVMLKALRQQGLTPATIIDVGANVGQFAVASAKLFPHASIYAYEPQPVCVDQLRRNVRALPQVVVRGCALGDKPGQADMNVSSVSHSSSLLKLGDRHLQAFPEAAESGLITVEVRTLDDEFAATQLKSPTLLKLDVQGYEHMVLSGAPNLLAKVEYVIMEASFQPLYEGELTFVELLDKMKERGFRFLRPVGSLAHPRTGEVLQIDALFENMAKAGDIARA